MRKIKNYLYVLLVATCQATTGVAQERDEIATKYKSEQAVITEYKEHLTIKNEDGKLTAHSEVTTERLLISDLSPGMFSKVYIYHSSFSQLQDVDAYADIPSKKGYKKNSDYTSKTSPSEDNSILYDDGKETELSFTGLTKNSLIHTTYSIAHTDVNMLPVFYFQDNMRVVQSTFEVTAPAYVNLKFVLKGNHTNWVQQTKEESKSTVTYTFTATDLPALKSYSDVPSISYYAPHVIPYITSYKLPHQEKETKLLNDPESLYAYYYNFIKNVNITDDKQLDSTVTSITNGDKTQLEKAAHIYQWVQKNMHYIAFEDSLEGFIPRQAADICKRKFGDCKDMASVLTAMCRRAGIEAYFTWIGTRHKPYTFEETPLPMVSNHMICAIKSNNEWIFLDGTDPFIPFGFNPQGIQGKEALIGIDDKHFKIVKVPETNAEANTISDTTFMHIDKRRVSGSVKLTYKGYPSWSLQTMMMYYKSEEREKYIQNLVSRGSNKYIQQKYTYSPVENEHKDVWLSSDFTIDDYVQNVGKEYYVNMNLNREFEDNYVDTSDRDVPLSYKYKEQMKEVVVMDIPDGFHAAYTPPDATISVNDAWNYKISYKSSPKTVTLIKEYELKTLSIGTKQFADNNEKVEELKKQYKESVVLAAN